MAKQLRAVRFTRGPTGERGGQINEAITGIQKVMIGIDRALEKCLEDIGNDILGEAQDRAPVDTGALVESGRSKLVEGEENYSLEISFGGPENKVTPTSNTGGKDWVDYAAFVHEDLGMNHPNGGEAKFLENAFNNQLQSALTKIRTCVRESVNRRGN